MGGLPDRVAKHTYISLYLRPMHHCPAAQQALELTYPPPLFSLTNTHSLSLSVSLTPSISHEPRTYLKYLVYSPPHL